MPSNDPTPAAALLIGRASIPAKNVAEWEQLYDEIHELTVSGKGISSEKRVRLYVLQGLSQVEAELLAVSPEAAECDDTRAI